MKNFFFFIAFLFFSKAIYAQNEYLTSRVPLLVIGPNETLPMIKDWEGEKVGYGKWEDYFQEQVDVMAINKNCICTELRYQIHFDKKGKVTTVNILNPYHFNEVNEQAYKILNSIKDQKILPAQKSGKNVDFILEGYLLFSKCYCDFYGASWDEEVEMNVREDVEPKIYITVEEMPVFGVCEGDPGQKKDMCTEANVSEYIKSELSKYTFEVEGKVYVKFVVSENGNVEDVSIAKGHSIELNNIALKIFENMPPWQAGKQRGKLVKIYKIIPVSFVK